MPINPSDISRFIEDGDEKSNSELLGLLVKRIDDLCFKECEIDRIACTLQPQCSRRFLLRLRIKNGLQMDDLPKFCYSVHKSVVLRDFLNKTVVYKPLDSYLYLVDFLDIFFHGDYRKLNKFLSFQNWDDFKSILDKRIEKKETFEYIFTGNHIIFKYDDKLHVVFLNEKYVLCNALREPIPNLEILKGICDLYHRLYFQDARMHIIKNQYLRISTKISGEIINKLSETYNDEEKYSKADTYFWKTFYGDIEGLLTICKQIRLNFRKNDDLEIDLYLGLQTNLTSKTKSQNALRYRDMRLVLNFIYRIYNDFYVVWVKEPEKIIEI